MSCGADSNVIRFMPPLVVSDDEIDRALAAFETCTRRGDLNRH